MTDIDATGPLPSVPPRIRSRMGSRSSLSPSIPRRADFHPAWWVVLAAAAAWIFMVGMHIQPAPHGHAGHGSPSHATGMGYGGLWMMTIAMMLPLTFGWVRDVARATSARHRATAAFLTGYLAVWMIAILLIDAAWELASSTVGSRTAVVGMVFTVALWEIAAAVYPPIRRCDRSMPELAPGWRADAASARFGVEAGGSCLLSCWALMAACVAFAHNLWVMIGLFIVQMIGRYRPLRIDLRGGGAHHLHPTKTAAAPVR
jgi:hypothetical protein